MKVVTPILLGLLQMAGCSVGKPSMSEVTSIEAATQKSACVGPLDRWHRLFAFQKRGDRIDPNLISVTYVQAGHRGLRAGRFIAEPGWPLGIDDAQFRFAQGTFDRTTRRFVEWSCGCNFGPQNANHEVECQGDGG